MSLVEMLNIFVVKPSSPPVPSCSLILCQPLPWPALPIGHLNLVRSFVDCDMTHLLGRDACGQRFVVGVPGSPGQMSFMQCEVSVSAASPRGAPGWPASSTWDHGSAQRVVVLGVLRVGPPGRCSSGQRCRVPGAHDRAVSLSFEECVRHLSPHDADRHASGQRRRPGIRSPQCRWR